MGRGMQWDGKRYRVSELEGWDTFAWRGDSAHGTSTEKRGPAREQAGSAV